MTKQPEPKPNPSARDPEQSKRFKETARHLGANEDPKAFEEAFRKIVPPKKAKP